MTDHKDGRKTPAAETRTPVITGGKPVDPRRRELLAGIAAATGAFALGGCGGDGADDLQGGGGGGGSGQGGESALPPPEESGIDHIVVVMMENRSFDHYLGWVPGADGLQEGLAFPDKNGVMRETFHLASHEEYGYQGCGKEDPGHGYGDGRVHLNEGAMDGWLQTVDDANVDNDFFPIGYYTADDVPFFKGVVENYTICDRYFTGILGSTFPNRVYMHSGATDRTSNGFAPDDFGAPVGPTTIPTVWDRLAEVGASRAYYFQDLPVTAFWGQAYLDITRPYSSFLLEAAAGLLPSVSFVEPFFGAAVGESPYGISTDDHPQADIRNGQAFLNQVYNALRNGPNWDRTLLVINYDEWGGFYDHVVPPVLPVSEHEASLGNDGRLGFRVPCAIIGPRARRGHVSHTTFSPSSILKMIEWRFGTGPVSLRSEYSNNMATALDFSGDPHTEAPAFNVPTGPFGMECGTGFPQLIDVIGPPTTVLPSTTSGASSERHPSMDAHAADWQKLYEIAKGYGFPV